MNKTITILAIILLAGAFAALPAMAATITVKVDDSAVFFPDAQPFADENSRVQVPIRFPMEALGVSVEWNQATQQAILSKGSTTAIFTLGSNKYTVNGVAKSMDTVPVVQSSRTLFPIRFAAEAFGATVSWDQATMTASIKSGQVDQVPKPAILQYPGDKSKMRQSSLLEFTTTGNIFGVKVQCTNNDLINQTIGNNRRLDKYYNGTYFLTRNKYYGSDASYQVQPGEVLIFDVWVKYQDSNHKVCYGQALYDYTFTVPSY